MKNIINKIIKDSVIDLLNNTVAETKITKIIDKHSAKLHFVPIRYRIFGGLLQSLNIQFGNFIEVLVQKIAEKEKKYEIINNISGKKNVPLSLDNRTDATIDRFITNRQTSSDGKLDIKFKELLVNIIKQQNSNDVFHTTKHDVDVLFREKHSGKYYYIEVKYNDDHDTGKFVDINRKFLKTYAGLVKKLNIKDIRGLKPILYYFNMKKMKGNIYVPESTHIYRGDKLFREFFSIKYNELDEMLRNVSEDKEIVKIFDDLFKKIRNYTWN